MTCQLDICGNINTVLTLAAAGLGWWLVHRLNSARDRINSERAMRTSELSKVYQALVRAGMDGSLVRKDHDGKVLWGHREVEDAVARIYLYGTEEQIALAQEYVKSFDSTQGADATKLVDSLRNHIRSSLGLKSVGGLFNYLRVTTGSNGGT